MGTPQARWRETTQSGSRLDHAADAVLALRRHEARVADGLQRASRASVSPASPSIGRSMAMNHCGVLRKITGFFDRQECG